MKVFGGVLVFGGITAADVSAFEAEAKVNPGVAHFQAFFATGGVRGHFVEVREMCAGRHDGSPLRELKQIGVRARRTRTTEKNWRADSIGVWRTVHFGTIPPLRASPSRLRGKPGCRNRYQRDGLGLARGGSAPKNLRTRGCAVLEPYALASLVRQWAGRARPKQGQFIWRRRGE